MSNLDVFDNDENRLCRTAVAQVFAFTFQAIRAQPPPQSWHDAAECLETWNVEFEDMLSKIPASAIRQAQYRECIRRKLIGSPPENTAPSRQLCRKKRRG